MAVALPTIAAAASVDGAGRVPPGDSADPTLAPGGETGAFAGRVAQPASARPAIPIQIAVENAAQVSASEADLTRTGFPAELTTL
jgi:hypothetical protein